jgi:alpha-L-fucosidase 2
MKTVAGAMILLTLAATLARGGQTNMETDMTDTKNAVTTLWYRQPANDWVEALPIGNGRLGAMVFGGSNEARYQFNEDTLWTGQPCDYLNPKALETLPKVRQLLFEGKQEEAQGVARDMMSIPLRQQAYQPFGDLRLAFPGHEDVADYRRELDLDTGVARTRYRVGDTTFEREVFSSFPDQAIVVRVRADKPGGLTFTASLDSPHEESRARTVAENELVLAGRPSPLSKGEKPGVPCALKFEARLKVITEGGKTSAADNGLSVEGADSATLVLVAATNYKNFQDTSADPAKRCEKALAALDGKSYKAVRAGHVADHQRLFRRVSLDLGGVEAAEAPTDERLERFGNVDDPALMALYFQFGRYLMIAGSRAGGQPTNLQGLWNDKLKPSWDSKYTVNINTEMNYWPTELCNLSECHDPLFDMLDDLVVTGGRVAKEHYGARGWVLHHNTDIWRGAAPINATNHGIWPTGGAWLCRHLWERYLFTQDRDFLARRAYPVMKGAALFFVDSLVEDPRNDWLVSTPSNSPENGGLVAGPTMDHQIIRSLFDAVAQAADILGIDADLAEQLREMRKRIAPNQIGQHGQLQEWLEDKDNPENTHRHVSHLWGLHPGAEITARETPDLFGAARQSLIFRGDGGTGWSMGWKINLWARLLDGDHAQMMLRNQLSPVGPDGKKIGAGGEGKGGTYANLFDAHPPFQIDGNFGATSGIAEMLLQSHAGDVHLLPALPSAWPKGSVKGLCARGGFVVDMDWREGRLAEARVRSASGGSATIRYGEKTVTIELAPGETHVLDDGLSAISG